ncbi:MAG: DUF3418 domain-containing protein [Proteobacteria bacterium]|nr:DUF3418 domain-containing protein [Pseudomonadota bacterium]
MKTNGNIITIYPSLIEEDGKVYRYAFDDLDSAEYYLRFGLRKLLKTELVSEIKDMRKNLRGIDKLALRYSNIGTKKELINAIVNLVLEETFLYEEKLIRKQDRFYATLNQDKQNLLINSKKVCALLEAILETYIKVMSRLSDPDVLKFADATRDIEDQVDYLIFNGFIADVPYKFLRQYPRYFDAILKRIEKLEYTQEKDRQNTLLIEAHWNRIKKLVDNTYETDSFSTTYDEYRWMIEELRISLFTQELKTNYSISIKRMDRKWDQFQKTYGQL